MPDGKKLAWELQILPANDKYPESHCLQVTSLSQKRPERCISLRARARVDLRTVLAALADLI